MHYKEEKTKQDKQQRTGVNAIAIATLLTPAQRAIPKDCPQFATDISAAK